MSAAPTPDDELARIAKLKALGVLDTPPEASFENAVRLASFICGTPTALVSLVDTDRQWFKAKVGLDVPETPREVSFCAHALTSPGPMIVRNALDDVRFSNNPIVVGDPKIRFYAGVPLRVGEGSAVGTLCVIDTVPRDLSAEQIAALSALAEQVATELMLRRSTPPSRPPESAPASSSGYADTGVDSLAFSARTGPGGAIDLALQPGELVSGRYQIERILGRGGMGVVYAAIDVAKGERVALKFLLPPAASTESAVERFVREARALLSVRSHHIAQVFDVGNLPSGEPFIVMEHLEGRDLEKMLFDEETLAPAFVVDAIAQASLGVADAHAAGVLHRDLKPSNVFVASKGDGWIVKILDFGVAKLSPRAGHETGLTNANEMIGSVDYMSPEQVLGAGAVDVRSDVWSLGVILYQLLTGHAPFRGDTMIQICVSILQQPVVPPRQLRPDIAPELDALVLRCLEKNAHARPQTARELAMELRRIGLPLTTLVPRQGLADG
jgi:predicted Ser/Thr protein kinase